MAWCGLVLEQAENNIVNKNKCLEDVDELNKGHTLSLSELSRLSEEKKNLEATLSKLRGVYGGFDFFFCFG